MRLRWCVCRVGVREGGAVEFVAVRVATDTLDDDEGTEAAALARLGDAFPGWKAQRVSALRWQDLSKVVPKEERQLLTTTTTRG